EVRIDQSGTDNDEFFELFGTPNGSLDNLWYVVIGDGSTGSGTVEAAIDLTGQVLDANGFFVAAEATFTLGTANLTTNLNFENSDNVTHLLVCNFTGVTGDDLDTDDDGTLDSTPWSEVVSGFSLVESVGSGDQVYGASLGLPEFGPDGDIFVPAHVFLNVGGDYVIGTFSFTSLETIGSLAGTTCRDFVRNVSTTTIATNADACTNTDGYTYYDDPNTPGNNYFFAINWDPSNTGGGFNLAARLNAEVTVTVDPALFGAEDSTPGSEKATYTMARYWNVDLQGNTLDGPVNVRFFYELSEQDDVVNASANFAGANGVNDEGFSWFKTFDTEFIPSNSVEPAQVQFGIELVDANPGVFENGERYAQFESITFSGGTGLSGAGTSNQLDLELLSFEGEVSKAGNKLNWEAIVDASTTEFVIERANSTGRFEAIGSVVANADLEKTQYNYLDEQAPLGVSLYRLAWTDLDGVISYSEVIALKRSTVDQAIFPNPVHKTATIVSANLEGEVLLEVFHVSGQRVKVLSLPGDAFESGYT
ncbi:MAG: hypothetical protein AAFV80_22990, partial [Bacteroidota bacterium]